MSPYAAGRPRHTRAAPTVAVRSTRRSDSASAPPEAWIALPFPVGDLLHLHATGSSMTVRRRRCLGSQVIQARLCDERQFGCFPWLIAKQTAATKWPALAKPSEWDTSRFQRHALD